MRERGREGSTIGVKKLPNIVPLYVYTLYLHRSTLN